MTLPLFPSNLTEPPVPPDKPMPATDTARAKTANEPKDVPTPAPLSIRAVSLLIQDALRPLTLQGRRIVHAQWIRPGVNAGPRGFLSVTLADTEDSGCAIDAFIWERRDVDAILKQGRDFGCDLLDRENRCEVMLDVTIDYWQKKAKPYLRIHGLNQIGMKGLRQQQKEATLRRLEQEGLLETNKQVRWARPALRILCIAKRESDGCRDALSILNRSGFRFSCTVHNVAVQGAAALPTLLEAFAAVGRDHRYYDVIMLIRGGGSELDLLSYDEYAVARAVALCPLPVVTGLGHTADRSLCDVVSARSLETPTAAARHLVDLVQEVHDELQRKWTHVQTSTLELIHRRRQRLLAQRPQFIHAALSLLHQHRHRCAEQWHGVLISVQTCLHAHRRRLQELHTPIRAHAGSVLAIRRARIAERFRSALNAAPALVARHRHRLHMLQHRMPFHVMALHVTPSRQRLSELLQRIHQRVCELIRLRRGRLDYLHAHIQAASPERYFAMGLAFVKTADGRTLRQIADVNTGESIQIRLQDGTVSAKVTKKEPHDH